MRDRAQGLLRSMFSDHAEFRPGQWEAIDATLGRRRVLVVQRTGWGKSLIYLLSTRLLRESGAGPTLLISPLLSLMRNQIEMAAALGVTALTINSTNQEDWPEIVHRLHGDEVDLLLVSPERLANEEFRRSVLQNLRVGLIVVDEAHCISDWGHDFRPDYRRIASIARALPRSVPIVATTATASTRVVEDIVDQLGTDLLVQRGPLTRESLIVTVLRLPDQAQRLAWLAENIQSFEGSGIVYCLTVADTERVARWLERHGIAAEAYHGRLDSTRRESLERALLENRVKALVATVALGMGFDKPDLGFVVHFQRPGSVVSYYQQIGRAGRAMDTAHAVLLHGDEDDVIQEYFIRTAFPAPEVIAEVLRVIEDSDGLTLGELSARMNIPRQKLEQCLKFLDVDGAIVKRGTMFERTLNPWTYDHERAARITELRHREQQRMRDLFETTACLMQFIAAELDDREAPRCGRCANCAGLTLAAGVDPRVVTEASEFLKTSYVVIEPRAQWPIGVAANARIPNERRNQPGRALCVYGDAGWGAVVRSGKSRGRFSDELVGGFVRMVREWRPAPPPRWITTVPSTRHGELLRDFATRVATGLGIPYIEALARTRPIGLQKLIQNGQLQARNVYRAYLADPALVRPEPVLLIDDLVDSRWTLTSCGLALQEAGSGPVHPAALASSALGSDT